ncbi:MAG: spoIIAA [Clostridiales bacterium]|jgi:stage II sporulation protein AA (anti-sigma F factor antagonist)|nr:spoIIAA [Clostridiales bacterium]
MNKTLQLTKENGVFYLQIRFTNKGNTLVIGITGELDHHSAEYIRQKVDAEMMKATTKNIVFDFSKVSFMDSSGIGVIMGRYKNIIKLSGKTAIINANIQIKRILEMSGILKIIPVYDSINDAMKHIS